MQRNLALVLAVALSGCSSTGPERGTSLRELAESNVVVLTAASRVLSSSAGRALEVSVTVSNRAESPVAFLVGLDCPVVLRVAQIPLAAGSLTYNESDDPCARVGREIVLAVGGSESFTRTVSLGSVGGGVRPHGRFAVTATVTSGPRPPVLNAGEFELP